MDVFEMKFSKVFPLLIAKAQRKGRTEDEVFAEVFEDDFLAVDAAFGLETPIFT